MFDYLDFPEKYRIQKSIDKDTFLKKANLTEVEKEQLSKNLIRIELCYDLKFPDKSETVVVQVSLKSLHGRFTAPNVARIVGSSFPYDTLIFLRCNQYVRIAILQTKENTLNPGRKVITGTTCTEGFFVNHLYREDKELLAHISLAYDSSNSSSEFQNNLLLIALKVARERSMTKEMKVFRQEQRKRENKKKAFLMETYYDDTLPWHGLPRDDEYGKSGKGRLVSDCGAYSYGLYEEMRYQLLGNSTDYDEDGTALKWLELYCEICFDFAKEFESYYLTKHDMEDIIHTFRQEIDYRTCNYQFECFDVDELKLFLEEYEMEIREIFVEAYFDENPIYIENLDDMDDF